MIFREMCHVHEVSPRMVRRLKDHSVVVTSEIAVKALSLRGSLALQPCCPAALLRLSSCLGTVHSPRLHRGMRMIQDHHGDRLCCFKLGCLLNADVARQVFGLNGSKRSK